METDGLLANTSRMGFSVGVGETTYGGLTKAAERLTMLGVLRS